MSTSPTSPSTDFRGPQSPPIAAAVSWLLTGNRWAAVVLAALVAMVVGAVALDQPLVALLVMLAVPLVLLIVVWPEAPIPFVIFILYSNAAVVAVRFHGVPGLAAAMLPAVLVIPLARHILLHREPIMFTATLPWVMLFMVIQMLSVLVSKHPQEAWQNAQATVFEGTTLYIIITNVVRSRATIRYAIAALLHKVHDLEYENCASATIRYAIAALLLAGAFMGGLSVFQQATRTFDNQYGGFAQVPGRGFRVAEDGIVRRQSRLCGPIGEQNRYAQVMLMLVPLGLFHFLAETTVRRKVLTAGAAILSAAGCVLAFSRGAAIGFGLMLVMMVMMGQLKIRHLMILVAAAGILLLASPQYRTRLASIQSLVDVVTTGHTAEGELDGAVRGRLTVMLAAARVAADYPLLGVGPGMFNYYSREYGNDGGLRAIEGTREAHCLYLELAAEHGFLGLGCFLVMVGVTLRNLSRVRWAWQDLDIQLSHWATGFLFAMSVYLATGLFLHLSYARYFWLMLALSDATSAVGRREAQLWNRRGVISPALSPPQIAPV